MKLVNVFFKIFATSGLISGILFTLLLGMGGGIELAIKMFLICGSVFGIFTAIVLIFSNKFYIKNNFSGTEDYISPFQQENTRINMPGKRLYKLCMESMAEIGAKVTYENLQEGTIKAITMPHWKSFGEKIEIQLLNDASAPRNISVDIKSTPLFPLSAVDFGRSASHVEFITNFIDR